MNSKHKKTLKALFADNPPKTLPWADIESLFIALGASVNEGSGSRVKFDLNGETLAFHRPHNPTTARIYQIILAREFFEGMGILP